MKILLGDLKDKADELASFLEARVGTKATSTGSEINIEDASVRKGVKPRDVKTYIKRFLHKEGKRKSFRVLVAGTELRLVRLEGVEEEEEEKKAPAKKEEEKAPSKKEESPEKEEKPQPEEEEAEPKKEEEEAEPKKEEEEAEPKKEEKKKAEGGEAPKEPKKKPPKKPAKEGSS